MAKASKVVERIRAYGLKEPRIGFERYFVDFALYDGLRQAFPEKNFIGAADLFYRIRSVKEAQEIEFMRRAAAAACRGRRNQYHNIASTFYKSAFQEYRQLITTNLVAAETYILMCAGKFYRRCSRIWSSRKAGSSVVLIFCRATSCKRRIQAV
ncbi:Creatinase, N-terminal [Moorella glycerini]|uniref:Creatinase N-terminal domain-containing protein n=1 Tax=Neomoorella stamsii TaxID=1266720 RepID=A0A9X7P785_9FIRM|nr:MULTISPECIES: aminopeptidase P family N-terminal domain-containing protein [Moorella]PRR75653.1 hypothetical protein MOST_08360 [Moorella stamsii]CEP66509.1 Creatinase, N-terminal [Moorella glycerini]